MDIGSRATMGGLAVADQAPSKAFDRWQRWIRAGAEPPKDFGP